ncbi:MmyB family transcriptional regulator [Curtobacterium flaccumfaciens]|uniref:MmyB family transcriptional regulator n=1 Tax=Curtobacterium flaccumfaciens TaxID=2035 RepID=UPI00344A464D
MPGRLPRPQQQERRWISWTGFGASRRAARHRRARPLRRRGTGPFWAEHDVTEHSAGGTNIHHPVVGALELTYEAMTLSADLGLTLVDYAAASGSDSAERLSLLSSWAATERSAPLGEASVSVSPPRETR